MAPQSCVMNPAQGSPALDTSRQDKAAEETGAEELDMAPRRSCKTKGFELPFSVESLISDRTSPCSSSRSSDLKSGCVRTEETECASPRGICGSKLEAVDLSEKERTWLQDPYHAHTSKLEILSLLLLLLIMICVSIVVIPQFGYRTFFFFKSRNETL